jgi:hypothetical protein
VLLRCRRRSSAAALAWAHIPSIEAPEEPPALMPFGVARLAFGADLRICGA